ncbi:MAG: hypothetical protein ACREPI_13190 [Candidatus Dormibacterales bacterium]
MIEGEASLILGRPRPAREYRTALERIAVESRHMCRLVDDLVWLARAESDPGWSWILGGLTTVLETGEGLAGR